MQRVTCLNGVGEDFEFPRGSRPPGMPGGRVTDLSLGWKMPFVEKGPVPRKAAPAANGIGVAAPALVVERHDEVTKENGPYIANGSMRSLRAVYNHARKSNTDLPPVNPVSAIDWNKEHRRKTGMGANDISGWRRELRAMDNPLRREFYLLTLFSGSRPTALKKVRIEHIDLHHRMIHVPRPKVVRRRHSTFHCRGR